MTPSPTIGLSFIFRDDIDTIDAMLASVLPYVDEVVCVDTGSSDGTRERIEEVRREHPQLRWEIVDFEWIDDFAAARQVGWSQLRSDWGLWIDCDDMLDGAEQLRGLSQVQGIDAFIMPYDYAQAATGECVCTLIRERLVRGPQRWQWASPVHEVLMPNFPANFQVLEFPIYRHRKTKQEDGERNLRIIENYLARTPENPDLRMLIYHATELASRSRHEEAIEAFKRYLPLAGWGEEKHQAFHRLADSFRALGRIEEAIECEAFAMTHAADHEQPEWADHHFGMAECLMAKGQHAHAIPYWHRGLELGMPQSSMILNPRDYDYLPHFNLGLCWAAMQRYDKALEHFLKASTFVSAVPELGMNIRLAQIGLSHDQAVENTCRYLETLIRFDENLKAREALKTLPYAVRTNPRVRELADHIRKSTPQISSRKAYEKMYATNREVRNPDDFVENASEVFGRVKFLVEGLKEQGAKLEPVRLLDAGCNDGWVAAHVEHKLGLAVADGIDLNPEAVAAAQERKRRFKLQGRYECGFVESAPDVFGEEQFDAVACFEVFEHLVDPHESFAQLERTLKPGGRMYVSTPVGAFEHGLIENWQQNWAKQHLRAVTPVEFARFALQRGRLTGMDVGAEGVQTLSYIPRARKGHIVFYTGQAWEPWSALDIEGKGLGGSETAVVQMATHLADDDWFVEVYGTLSHTGPLNGVLYRDVREFDPDEHCDVLVSSRNPQLAMEQPNATDLILWLHDFHYGGLLRETVELWDKIFTLSEAHEDALIEAEGLNMTNAQRFVRTRNGIELDRYKKGGTGFAKRKKSVIYSSSPDRGLPDLLRLWPRILEKAPGATLDVYYGFEVFDRMHAANAQLMAWKNELVALAESLPGVKMHGRVSQNELAAAQCSSRVWAYPYAKDNDTETSCITAMEAMAAGMGIVTTGTAALPETLGNVGFQLPGTPGEEDYDRVFVESVARLLTRKDIWDDHHRQARRRAKDFAWKDEALRWSEMFDGVLNEKERQPALRGR